MNDPVNLENVRGMLNGNPVRERELFNIYMEASEECLTIMKDSLMPNSSANWRLQAQSLKGMSMNLGAACLGQLCAEAFANDVLPEEGKRMLYGSIHAEYMKVKDFLIKQMEAADPSSL